MASALNLQRLSVCSCMLLHSMLRCSDLLYAHRVVSPNSASRIRTDIVLLQRPAALGRNIGNELQVQQTIEQYLPAPMKLKLCSLANMQEFASIVACFQSARVIIGVHSGDLSQVLWAHTGPDTALIEIGFNAGSVHMNNMYQELCTRLHIPYYLVFGSGQYQGEIQVDIPQLSWAMVRHRSMLFSRLYAFAYSWNCMRLCCLTQQQIFPSSSVER